MIEDTVCFAWTIHGPNGVEYYLLYTNDIKGRKVTKEEYNKKLPVTLG
jgi:hypothetical protein